MCTGWIVMVKLVITVAEVDAASQATASCLSSLRFPWLQDWGATLTLVIMNQKTNGHHRSSKVFSIKKVADFSHLI